MSKVNEIPELRAAGVGWLVARLLAMNRSVLEIKKKILFAASVAAATLILLPELAFIMLLVGFA